MQQSQQPMWLCVTQLHHLKTMQHSTKHHLFQSQCAFFSPLQRQVWILRCNVCGEATPRADGVNSGYRWQRGRPNNQPVRSYAVLKVRDDPLTPQSSTAVIIQMQEWLFGLPEWSGCWRLVCMFRSLICTAVIHRQQLMRRLKDAAFVIPLRYSRNLRQSSAGHCHRYGSHCSGLPKFSEC